MWQQNPAPRAAAGLAAGLRAVSLCSGVPETLAGASQNSVRAASLPAGTAVTNVAARPPTMAVGAPAGSPSSWPFGSLRPKVVGARDSGSKKEIFFNWFYFKVH